MIDALRDILDPRLIALLIVAFGAWKALAFFYVGLQPHGTFKPTYPACSTPMQA